MELPDPHSDDEVFKLVVLLLLKTTWQAVAALEVQPPKITAFL